MHVGVGKASGKIILMGEHAVVYGQPAIAIPFLATKVVATVTPATEDSISSSYFEGPLILAPATLKNIIESIHVAKNATELTETICITIESSIPPERGMGSSAAVANAVIRAIFDYTENNLTAEKLTELATIAEKIAHGNPSGIDQAATNGKHPVYFVKGQPLQEFPINLNGFLIVSDSKIKGRTREVVTDVAELLKKQPENKTKIARLGELTEITRHALTHNKIHELATAMTEAQIILASLTISSPELNHLLELGLKNGALAGKLTGGGRGGCVFFVTTTLATADKIQNALIRAGLPTWVQELKELK